jgi:hypothetical protein
MSGCPNHCHTCLNETNIKRKMVFKEAKDIRTCRMGLMPSIGIDMGDIPDLASDSDDDEPYVGEDVLEDGDHVFIATIPCEAEFIRATLNVSQHLAEVFHKILQLKFFHESITTHFHNFKDLFLKLSFDHPSDQKIWDHMIKLVPGAKASSCKVYPLTPSKQSEIDAFIHKNLSSGRIHPSKSPMASLVFFIKKKNGTLHLIQDCRALNTLTIKNRYPLPLILELVNQLHGTKYLQSSMFNGATTMFG